MAVRPNSPTLKSVPTPFIVVTLVVVLAIFLGWLAYANLFAPPRAVPMSAQAQAKNDRLKILAQQSGGDMSKLSEADRNWVNQVTGGYGAMVLHGLVSEKK